MRVLRGGGKRREGGWSTVMRSERSRCSSSARRTSAPVVGLGLAAWSCGPAGILVPGPPPVALRIGDGTRGEFGGCHLPREDALCPLRWGPYLHTPEGPSHRWRMWRWSPRDAHRTSASLGEVGCVGAHGVGGSRIEGWCSGAMRVGGAETVRELPTAALRRVLA